MLAAILGVLISILLLLFDWLWGFRVAGYILWRRVSRIQVLDQQGKPVPRAKVIVAGLGRHITNRQGYAKFYVPRADAYGLIVTFPSYSAGHYMEEIEPGETYRYKPNEKLERISKKGDKGG